MPTIRWSPLANKQFVNCCRCGRSINKEDAVHKMTYEKERPLGVEIIELYLCDYCMWISELVLIGHFWLTYYFNK